ncbi:hypothetical protein GTW20_00060 [Nocardiopsis alba]|uniref:Recombination endonuclease VII n=1 Tax=Nocardiopsis alba TaxID=53437 RepID=A0A7K2ILI1_9ACTN|nr:hypothetical protein [Nocardiopsis alba]
MSGDGTHKPNRGGTCSHRTYLLTCEQYEGLRKRASYQCEICGKPESEEWLEVLRIDHAHHLGYWAVRGLLCHRCNCSFDLAAIAGPARDTYLKNSWYLHMLAELGLPPATPRSPPSDLL